LVYSEFGFQATTQPEGWPGFAEPEGSVTWSVAPLFGDFASRFVEAEISLAGHLSAAIDHLLGEDTHTRGNEVSVAMAGSPNKWVDVWRPSAYRSSGNPGAHDELAAVSRY